MVASFSGRGKTTLTLAVRDTENPVELRKGNVHCHRLMQNNVQCHRLMQNNSLQCESNRNNMALCKELISVALLGLVRKRLQTGVRLITSSPRAQTVTLPAINRLHSPYLAPIRLNCPRQRPILENPQPTFLPQCQRSSFTTI
jgi:hypothetical protein